jgi:lipopolysaccharide/colanic/teichoic acid biosynthesis glycosyltransferase
VKRLIDLVGSIAGIMLLGPVLLAAMLAIRIQMGRPVFFSQLRPGLHGKPFRMLKLRTMHNVVGRRGNTTPDSERLTSLGRFLRASSIDELPSLWNIVKGEMSLIGPRPLLIDYLGLYSPEQARRHEVRPGLTGWAQVNGRNTLSWNEKFALDIWYVDNRSLALDLRILWLTVKKVLAREGISAQGEATMPRFEGNK